MRVIQMCLLLNNTKKTETQNEAHISLYIYMYLSCIKISKAKKSLELEWICVSLWMYKSIYVQEITRNRIVSILQPLTIC